MDHFRDNQQAKIEVAPETSDKETLPSPFWSNLACSALSCLPNDKGSTVFAAMHHLD